MAVEYRPFRSVANNDLAIANSKPTRGSLLSRLSLSNPENLIETL